jgi:hypothetical protein
VEALARTKQGQEMRVYCFYNSWIAKFLQTYGIVLFPFIFFYYDKETSFKKKIINHEFVHVRQIRRIGFFKFYLSYFWDYCKRRFSGNSHEDAYENNPWEKEAYMMTNLTILSDSEKKEAGL